MVVYLVFAALRIIFGSMLFLGRSALSCGNVIFLPQVSHFLWQFVFGFRRRGGDGVAPWSRQLLLWVIFAEFHSIVDRTFCVLQRVVASGWYVMRGVSRRFYADSFLHFRVVPVSFISIVPSAAHNV